MRILEPTDLPSHAVTHFDSEGFHVAHFARASEVSVAFVRLEPRGIIGRHFAVAPQALLLVSGDAFVSGADDERVSLLPGQIAYWESGESHETTSETGMTALILEGELEIGS